MTDSKSQSESYRIDDLSLDVQAHRLSRNGTPIEIPKLSFDLLLELVRAAPSVVSIDELSNRVWGDVVVSDETVTQRVKLLRDSLNDDSQKRYIETVRSVGYRIGPAVIRGDQGSSAAAAMASVSKVAVAIMPPIASSPAEI